jgi:tight adherence protein B
MLAPAVLGALLGWRLAGPVGSVAGALTGGGLVEWRLARRRARRLETLELQLREAVMALSAAVRAGLSVIRGLEEAVRDAEEPLRSTLEGLLHRVEVGEPLEEALAGLAVDLRSSEAGLLVTALSVHRRSGGELPAMLEEVAEIIRQRVDARRQVRALTAQGRASGAVLAVLPVAFVTLLSGTSGDGLGAFYRTPVGVALLSVGLLCEALGFLWIQRIVRVRS